MKIRFFTSVMVLLVLGSLFLIPLYYLKAPLKKTTPLAGGSATGNAIEVVLQDSSEIPTNFQPPKPPLASHQEKTVELKKTAHQQMQRILKPTNETISDFEKDTTHWICRSPGLYKNCAKNSEGTLVPGVHNFADLKALNQRGVKELSISPHGFTVFKEAQSLIRLNEMDSYQVRQYLDNPQKQIEHFVFSTSISYPHSCQLLIAPLTELGLEFWMRHQNQHEVFLIFNKNDQHLLSCSPN